MYSKILVPLDGSTVAEQVLPYARFVSDKMALSIELVSVLDLDQIAAQLPSKDARFFDKAVGESTRQSSAYLESVAPTFSGRRVQCSLEKGRPEDVIIEKASADKTVLVAMATHGRSGLDRFLLGSVAEKVLRGTINPLLLIRAALGAKSSGDAVFKSIVVPLDGSEIAETVLPAAAEFSKRFDAEVTLLRAYQLSSAIYAGNEGLYSRFADELLASVRDEAQDYLEKQANQMRKLGTAQVRCVAQEGFASDEIIRFSQRTAGNLIVMGSHGRSGVRRWMLGSVAEGVARHSTAPLLILRSGG